MPAMQFDRRFVARLQLLWLHGRAWRIVAKWCRDTIDVYGMIYAPVDFAGDAERDLEDGGILG